MTFVRRKRQDKHGTSLHARKKLLVNGSVEHAANASVAILVVFQPNLSNCIRILSGESIKISVIPERM